MRGRQGRHFVGAIVLVGAALALPAAPAHSDEGDFVTFTDPASNVDHAGGIHQGPGGDLWFTSVLTDRIGRITPAGVITTYPDANIDAPTDLTEGPDGN